MKTFLLLFTVLSLSGLVSCKQSASTSPDDTKFSNNASTDDDVIIKDGITAGVTVYPSNIELEKLVEAAVDQAFAAFASSGLSSATGMPANLADHKKLVGLISAAKCDADSLNFLDEVESILGIHKDKLEDLLGSGVLNPGDVKIIEVKLKFVKDQLGIITKKIANC